MEQGKEVTAGRSLSVPKAVLERAGVTQVCKRGRVTSGGRGICSRQLWKMNPKKPLGMQEEATGVM